MSNDFEEILEILDYWMDDFSTFTTKQLLFLAEAATYAAAEGECLEAAIQTLCLESDFPLFLGKTFDSWVESARDIYEPLLLYTGLAIKCGNWVFTLYLQEIEAAAPSRCD